MSKGVYKRIKQNSGMFGKEEKHFKWLGDKVGYLGLHQWVEKWKGKPNKCEVCGIEGLSRYEWANVDHSYKRILEDYIRMCAKCHRKYDIEFNNYTAKRITYFSKKNPDLAKPIYQKTLEGVIIKEWGSAIKASQQLKISVSRITRCANKIKSYNSCGGFKWNYK